MYQNLVKNQRATQANAFHPASELAGEFTFNVLAFPGTRLDRTEVIIRRTLAEFEKQGVTDDDLARFKATFEANLIEGLSSVPGKVSQLASYPLDFTPSSAPIFLRSDWRPPPFR